jgi:hypothetical protein
MHNVVEVDTWTAAVSSVDDGDAASAANFGAADQDLADRTLYLRNRLPGAAASYVFPVCPQPLALGTRFTVANGYIANSDTTDAGGAYGVIQGLPSSGTITGFVANVTGIYTPGAHGGLIGTAPTVALVRCVRSTQSQALVGTTNDPFASTNLASYETEHLITSAALAEVISSDTCYMWQITGENGANKANDKFALWSLALTITP